jgi:hypothetical protein
LKAAAELIETWRRQWPAALADWSAYTLLRDPEFLNANAALKGAGMADQIAAIRLADNQVLVNVKSCLKRGLGPHGRQILAHEIGHHVYVPGNRADHARSLAAILPMLQGLPTATGHMVANLYADLHINDRLQRRAGLDMAAVYRALLTSSDQPDNATESQVWRVYMRTYELLWRLAPGTLTRGPLDPEMEGDALLCSELVRTFSADWLRGARRFAAVLYRYLASDQSHGLGPQFLGHGLDDLSGALPADGAPDGLAAVDDAELESGELPDLDAIGERLKKSLDQVPTGEGKGSPGKQFRTPYQYGQLLEALGARLPPAEVRARYYKERALAHLIPFPQRRAAQRSEPLAEGLQDWQPGDPLEELDVLNTLLQSPHVVPGVTTVQRVWGETPGADPARVAVDLDIYIDCSGSMPDPSVDVSYLALCAVILALSALRAGARVQATLWSSAGVFETTAGFIADEKRLLHVITGFVSGGTDFPIHVLRDTYQDRKPTDRPVHVVVISDDGVDTMLRQDEHGNDGKAVAKMALARARAGGSLVLNLNYQPDQWPPGKVLSELGWGIHAVRDWQELVAFARAFVLQNYGDRP